MNDEAAGPQPPERDLRDRVARASRGDVVAVDELVGRYLPQLEAYVRRRRGGLLAAKESSSDLVQSCCREVLEHVDRFQYDGEEGFRRWLFAMALRKMRDRHRFYRADKRDALREVQVDRESSDPLAALCRTLGTPSRAAVRSEQLARLREVLQDLEGKDRDIIDAVYLQQRTPSEVAEELGIPAAHARMRLSRALARLATRLGTDASRD